MKEVKKKKLAVRKLEHQQQKDGRGGDRESKSFGWGSLKRNNGVYHIRTGGEPGVVARRGIKMKKSGKILGKG